MATEKSEPRAERKDRAEEPDVPTSPEGVPYQTSGFDKGEVNEGPFEAGDGKNSPFLKANVEAAEANKAS